MSAICPACQAALRTAHASLEVIADAFATDEDRKVAAEELARAGDRLRPLPTQPREIGRQS